MTDAELLESYRATRDRSVLDSLFARHYPTVYHVVLKMVRNATDANDVTQSTFLKAVESADAWRPTGSLRNWLLTIAVNEVRQFRRSASRRNRPEHLQELARRGEPGRGQEGELQRREFEEHLEQALQHFPDELKDPLVLHYYQNLSYSEMAEVLAIPKSTVQFRMDQALQKLREQLRKHGVLALFAPFLPSRPVLLGLTAMKVKILATALVLLCCILPFSAFVRRSTRSMESGPISSSRPPAGAVPPGKTSASSSSAGPAEAPGIFGTVVERETERPIAGARISAFEFEGGTSDQTTSDEKGAFRLGSADGSAKTYHLKIIRKGYAPLSVASIAAASNPGIFRLSAGGVITGRVEDADGIPLFPYRIAAIRRQNAPGQNRTRASFLYDQALPNEWIAEESEIHYSPDGRFEIRHLPPGPYVLVVTMAGAYPFMAPVEKYPSDQWQIVVKEGAGEEVRIVRPPSGIVRVRVVDRETRQPIAGARIAGLAWIDRYQLDLTERPGMTDDNGMCEVPASISRYGGLDSTNLLVSKTGYATRTLTFAGQESGYRCEVALAKPARIHGHVRTRQGMPVARAAVFVECTTGGELKALVFTDAEGAYSAEGLDAPNEYAVQVFDPLLKGPRSTVTLLLREGEAREVNFGTSSQGSILGRVTRKGVPTAYAQLCLDGPGKRDRTFCNTTELGEYQFEGLAAGTYDLMITVELENRPSSYVTRRVLLGDGERMDVTFESEGFSIRGTAMDAATLQPLPPGESVEIIARRMDGLAEAVVSSRTGEKGQFVIDVFAPGRYQLTLDKDYDFYASNEPQVNLTAEGSADDVRVLLHRDKRDAVIRLGVVDAATGEPILDGWYHLTAGSTQGAGGFNDGAFTDNDAVMGRHHYELGTDEHIPVTVDFEISPSRRRFEETFRLVKADTVRVTQVLPSSVAEKAGIREGDLVVSYDGRPVHNVRILKAATSRTPATQKVALEIRRGGESRVLIVAGDELGIEMQNSASR